LWKGSHVTKNPAPSPNEGPGEGGERVAASLPEILAREEGKKLPFFKEEKSYLYEREGERAGAQTA